VVVLGALAAPLLAAWLGPEFREGAVALTILVGYWLITVNSVVAGPMLIAHGHAGWLARYSWVVALSNLSLSIALAGPLGLDGVVLGTAIPYLIAFPVFYRFVLRALPVSAGELWREAWLPGYGTGIVLLVLLVAVRLALGIEGIAAVAALGAAGLASYWLAFYFLWLRPAERRLVGDVVRGMLRAA
jgi:O-antigen/teichoic acid export membrane protein